MPQEPDLTTRREEARLAMEGDERRQTRIGREQTISKRRIDARLAMESSAHRARREVLERAIRESIETVTAKEKAEQETRAQAARLVIEAETRAQTQVAREQAEKTARVNSARQANAKIKTLKTIPTHLSTIRTLKTDMATAVSQGGSIASAIIRTEEINAGRFNPPAKSHAMFTTVLILLLLGTLAIGGTFYYQKWGLNLPWSITGTTTSTTTSSSKKSLITVENRIDINVVGQTTPVLLGKIREQGTSSATAGTIEELVFLKNVTSLNFRAWKILLALPFPDDLTRIIEPNFMFGLYYGATSSIPFIILKTKSTEQSYGQLLAWEKNLPTVWDILIGKPIATSSTPENTIRSAGVLPHFRDQIIQNLDTRILDGAGVIQPALYGFLDPNTIILTQTRAAFLEILTRFRRGQ